MKVHDFLFSIYVDDDDETPPYALYQQLSQVIGDDWERDDREPRMLNVRAWGGIHQTTAIVDEPASVRRKT